MRAPELNLSGTFAVTHRKSNCIGRTTGPKCDFDPGGVTYLSPGCLHPGNRSPRLRPTPEGSRTFPVPIPHAFAPQSTRPLRGRFDVSPPSPGLRPGAKVRDPSGVINPLALRCFSSNPPSKLSSGKPPSQQMHLNLRSIPPFQAFKLRSGAHLTFGEIRLNSEGSLRDINESVSMSQSDIRGVGVDFNPRIEPTQISVRRVASPEGPGDFNPAALHRRLKPPSASTVATRRKRFFLSETVD